MAEFPFDVILFDIGGVLLTNGWDHSERAVVLERFGVDRADFEARHAEHYRAWEIGAIPVSAYLDATVFDQERAFTQKDFFEAICAQSLPLPDGALGILGQLAASNACMPNKCILGALNNEARETNEFRLEHFGLRQIFQVALSSCYLGLRKPDEAIYRRALEILCRPAGRILLIDDREENVAAAVGVGMNAVLFEGADSLRRQLELLG